MKYPFQNKTTAFFLPYLVFLAVGLYLNIAFSQKEIFFWVNVRNTHFLDIIMPYCTDIGNGFFCVALCVLTLLFINIRFGLALGATYALEGIAVQVLKRAVFTGRPRPWAEYADKYTVHLVPNFTPYSNNSFPSGHTATVFCMAALIVLVYPQMKRIGHFALLILALCVAYSRIYLSQHYFVDIYVGSLIGITSSLVIYYYFYKHNYKSAKQPLWLDRTLLHLKG